MIYYVEDDGNIRDLAIYALKQAGFEAVGFADAPEFFAACKRRLEILRIVRENPTMKHVPVMMLTAKGTEFDKVTGLDAGADDYLAKPFGVMELVSRVNALLRRAQAPATATDDNYAVGPIELRSSSHTVTAGGEPVALTLKEFDLLRALMRHANRVLTRSMLLEEVWDTSFAGETRTVDVHIQTLRQKLAAACEGSDACIQTVRGVGYCIKEQE